MISIHIETLRTKNKKINFPSITQLRVKKAAQILTSIIYYVHIHSSTNSSFSKLWFMADTVSIINVIGPDFQEVIV